MTFPENPSPGDTHVDGGELYRFVTLGGGERLWLIDRETEPPVRRSGLFADHRPAPAPADAVPPPAAAAFLVDLEPPTTGVIAMPDVIKSVVRSQVVPAVVTFLVMRFASIGVEVDSVELAGVVFAVIQGLYYLLVRGLGMIDPRFERLLGYGTRPNYVAADVG